MIDKIFASLNASDLGLEYFELPETIKGYEKSRIGWGNQYKIRGMNLILQGSTRDNPQRCTRLVLNGSLDKFYNGYNHLNTSSLTIAQALMVLDRLINFDSIDSETGEVQRISARMFNLHSIEFSLNLPMSEEPKEYIPYLDKPDRMHKNRNKKKVESHVRYENDSHSIKFYDKTKDWKDHKKDYEEFLARSKGRMTFKPAHPNLLRVEVTVKKRAHRAIGIVKVGELGRKDNQLKLYNLLKKKFGHVTKIKTADLNKADSYTGLRNALLYNGVMATGGMQAFYNRKDILRKKGKLVGKYHDKLVKEVRNAMKQDHILVENHLMIELDYVFFERWKESKDGFYEWEPYQKYEIPSEAA